MPSNNRKHIQILDEIALNAWPALQTVVYDGWLLRFAGGMSRRANSVQTLYPSTLPLDEKIAYCEALYGRAGLKTIFRVTAASPDGLDERLAERGYGRDAETSIQTLSLNDQSWQGSAAATVLEKPAPEWLAAFCRLNHERAAYSHILARILDLIVHPAAFVSIERNGRVDAVGMAVAERQYVGLFGLAVNEPARRQGLGTSLVETCFAFGQQHGATQAYLQVMTTNAPALALYRRLGFEEAYRYWYRVAPLKGI